MSSKTSLVKHPARALFLTIREHYVAICDKSPDAACCAAILHIFVHWQDFKAAQAQQVDYENEAREDSDDNPQSFDAWFWIKQADLRRELFDIWAEKKISACLKWLEAEQLIESRHNPDKRYRFDRKLQYQVKIATLQARVDAWEIERDNLRSRLRQKAESSSRKAESSSKTTASSSRKAESSSKTTVTISQDSATHESIAQEKNQESSLIAQARLEHDERLIFILTEYEKIFASFQQQLTDAEQASLVDAYTVLGDNQFLAILARCANHGGKTWHYVVAALMNALETSKALAEQSLLNLGSWHSETSEDESANLIPQATLYIDKSVDAEIWRDDALSLSFSAQKCFDAALRQLVGVVDRQTISYLNNAQLVEYRFIDDTHRLTILVESTYAQQIALKLSRNFLSALAQTMNLPLSLASDALAKQLQLIFVTKDDWSKDNA